MVSVSSGQKSLPWTVALLTVTALLNVTRTSMVWPWSYQPSFWKERMETPVTVGAAVLAPFTLCDAWAPSAWLPRSSAAFVPRTLRIVPLFRVSAPAATERPSGSTSAAATTRRKICVVGLVPARFQAACAVAVPRVSARLGVPETPTA